MTTKEFMDLIGVSQPNTITKYLKSGVLNPKKVLGSYIFSDRDITDYNNYKQTGIRKYEKSLNDLEKYLKSVSTRDLIVEIFNRTDTKQQQTKPDQEPEYVWED